MRYVLASQGDKFTNVPQDPSMLIASGRGRNLNLNRKAPGGESPI